MVSGVSSTTCMTRSSQELWWRTLVVRTREQGRRRLVLQVNGDLRAVNEEKGEDEGRGRDRARARVRRDDGRIGGGTTASRVRHARRGLPELYYIAKLVVL